MAHAEGSLAVTLLSKVDVLGLEGLGVGAEVVVNLLEDFAVLEVLAFVLLDAGEVEGAEPVVLDALVLRLIVSVRELLLSALHNPLLLVNSCLLSALKHICRAFIGSLVVEDLSIGSLVLQLVETQVKVCLSCRVSVLGYGIQS